MESNKKNKGGRPPKKRSDKKQYRVAIYMDTLQYYTLKGSARTMGASLAECARDLISKGKVIERLNVEHLDLIRKLCGMANNLNQIARQANSQGYLSAEDECCHLSMEIDKIIKLISHDS